MTARTTGASSQLDSFTCYEFGLSGLECRTLGTFYIEGGRTFFGADVVGYGDFSPRTAAGKLFTVFYFFAGIGLIVAFLNAVARTAIEQRDEGRAPLGRRRRPPGNR